MKNLNNTNAKYFKTFFLIIIISIFFIPNNIKVAIRLFLFSSQKNILYLNLKPNNLINNGFLIDQEINYKELKRNVKLKNLDSDIIVTKILNSFNGYGGKHCGKYSNNLYLNLIYSKKGLGCCSDFSQSFIALASQNGVFAREISNSKHTFAEYYNTKTRKWIFVDPNYSLRAIKNNSREYLSYFEMRNIILFRKKNQKIIFAYLPKSNPFPIKFFSNLSYYDKNAVELTVLTNGNNVYTEDIYNQKFVFLPKSIRNFFFILFNISPSYICLIE